MSTLGSSVINKSSKKFAPKAAAQRRRPAEQQISEPSSTRASAEIQTPQPSDLPVAHGTGSSPLPAPSSSTTIVNDGTQRHSHDLGASPRTTRNTRSLRTPESPAQPAQSDVVPSKAHFRHDGETGSRASAIARPDVPRVPSEQGVLPTSLPTSQDQARDSSVVAIEPPSKRRRVDVNKSIEVAVPAPEVQARATRSRVSRVQRPDDDEAATEVLAAQRVERSEARAINAADVTMDDVASAAPPTTKRGRKAAKAAKIPEAPKTTKAARSTKTKLTAPSDTLPQNLPTATIDKAIRRRPRREPTPEDAETREIAPATMKMSDLCKDLRTGKKSKRQVELEKLDATEAAKRRPRKGRHSAAADGATTETAAADEETVDQRLERIERERQPLAGGLLAAPQMRVVDGRIVVDDQSLQIDRHAAATAAAPPMEEIVENELTRRVTSASWMKRSTKEAWDEETVEVFYQGLRMFGTDFEIISKMLPGKTRRHVKNKFVKEERANLDRINEALTGPRRGRDMNLDQYSKLTKVEYDEVGKFEEELEEEARKMREQEERLTREAGEIQRRRRREVEEQSAANAALEDGVEVLQSIEGGGGIGEGSAKENENPGEAAKRGRVGKARKAAKSKKKVVQLSRHGGGEEVEVLGTIGDLVGAAA